MGLRVGWYRMVNDVAVERKTYQNLLSNSGRGDQLRQTLTLRRAGFQNTFILLEGAQWKTREEVLHMDNAAITSEGYRA